MTTDPVEVVRRFYERSLSREGLVRVVTSSGPIEHVSPDVVVENFEEFMITEPYHGHDGVRQWAIDNGEGVRGGWLDLEEITDMGGGWVLTRHLAHGTATSTGIDFSLRFHAAIRVEDGLIVYVKGFREREDAEEAIRAA